MPPLRWIQKQNPCCSLVSSLYGFLWKSENFQKKHLFRSYWNKYFIWFRLNSGVVSTSQARPYCFVKLNAYFNTNADMESLAHSLWQSMQRGLWERKGAHLFCLAATWEVEEDLALWSQRQQPCCARVRRMQPTLACGALHPKGLSEGLADVSQQHRSKTKMSLSSAEVLCGVAQTGFSTQRITSRNLLFFYILQTERLVFK